MLLVVATCIFAACTSSKPALLNQEVTREEGKPILLGKCTREGMLREPHRKWFNSEYQGYKVDQSLLDMAKPYLKDVDIMLFMGTWCSDSRREVPHFYRILDYLKFREKKLLVVNLDNHPDHRKQSPQHEEQGWNIEYVPTFVFLKNGKEIGRIVEEPLVSLEADMMAILKKTD
jgi:thiol-disulfide isomerase/thioredoxin